MLHFAVLVFSLKKQNWNKTQMPHICSPKHWNSEMLKGTCIWYWGGTCWANAVGSGHNCTLFGCFRKENYEAKKGWHKWSLSLTNRIVTELNVHHHKDNIMKFLKKNKKKTQTTWLNTYSGQSRCHWKHHLSAEPSPGSRRGKKKNLVDDGTSTKSRSKKNTIKTQEPSWLLNTIWSPAELCPGLFWVVLFMLVKAGTTFSAITIQLFDLGHHGTTTVFANNDKKIMFKTLTVIGTVQYST